MFFIYSVFEVKSLSVIFGGSLKYMIWHVIKTLNMAIEETVVKVLVYRDTCNYFD